MDNIHKEILNHQFSDVWKGLKVQSYEELTSTNDWVKEYLKKDPKDELLVLAKKQTKGRGRSGRSFYSNIDHGLYFSIGIHPKNIEAEKLPLYTIATAAALMQAVREVLGIELKVKWVNDLFYEGRKVSGILSEAITNPETNRISSLVIGIGLNLAGSFEEADIQTQQTAGSLYEKLPAEFNVNKLVKSFLFQFKEYHQDIGARKFLPIYEKQLLGIGQEVSYVRKNKKYSGVIHGVNRNGHLQVKNKKNEWINLFSDEIHFSSQQFTRTRGE